MSACQRIIFLLAWVTALGAVSPAFARPGDTYGPLPVRISVSPSSERTHERERHADCGCLTCFSSADIHARLRASRPLSGIPSERLAAIGGNTPLELLLQCLIGAIPADRGFYRAEFSSARLGLPLFSRALRAPPLTRS